MRLFRGLELKKKHPSFPDNNGWGGSYIWELITFFFKLNTAAVTLRALQHQKAVVTHPHLTSAALRQKRNGVFESGTVQPKNPTVWLGDAGAEGRTCRSHF